MSLSQYLFLHLTMPMLTTTTTTTTKYRRRRLHDDLAVGPHSFEPWPSNFSRRSLSAGPCGTTSTQQDGDFLPRVTPRKNMFCCVRFHVVCPQTPCNVEADGSFLCASVSRIGYINAVLVHCTEYICLPVGASAHSSGLEGPVPGCQGKNSRVRDWVYLGSLAPRQHCALGCLTLITVAAAVVAGTSVEEAKQPFNWLRRETLTLGLST